MSNYTTVEDLKQIPIEEIKEGLYNPSETVIEYLEYVLEHHRGVVMHPEDVAILEQRLAEIK